MDNRGVEDVTMKLERSKVEEHGDFVPNPELEKRLLRKLDMRILPTLWVMVSEKVYLRRSADHRISVLAQLCAIHFRSLVVPANADSLPPDLDRNKSEVEVPLC
jgi:hypothetical protein